MQIYPYLLAAHVTAVVFLVGGMFAHDRLMTGIAKYPQETHAGTLAVLLRLDRHIVTPALLLTWTFGLALALSGEWLPSRWLVIKLAFVVALSALHGIQSGRLRRSIGDGTPAGGIPGAGLAIVSTMFAVAVLAIVKPI